MASRNLSAVAPLAPSQLGMLIQALSSSEPGVHVEQLSWPLRGGIRTEEMRAAWSLVVEDCEVLRTGFVLRDSGEPLQCVMRSAPVEWETADFADLPDAKRRAALEAFFTEHRSRGFVLEKPPLMRLALVRLGADLHHFVWTFHHIILDGWSVPLLAERAFSVYESLVEGEPPATWRTRPYREFVSWLAAQPTEEHRTFWVGRLGSVALPTPLGPTSTDGSSRTGHGVHDAVVRGDVVAVLEDVRKRRRVSMATVVQGAWSLLLSHSSGQDDVVFGATVSGRPPQFGGIESMVGLFINTIPIRVEVPRGGDLWSWLADEQIRRSEEQRFEHCSTSQIHQWLGLAPTRPVFESVLVFENYPVPSAAAAEGRTVVTSVRSEGSQTQFPLAIMVVPDADLRIRVVSRRSNLDDDGGAAIAGNLASVIALMASPECEDMSVLRDRIGSLTRPVYRMPSRSSGTAPQREGVPADLVTDVSSICAEVLGITELPDPDANFFDLGGESLLALRFARTVRDRLGADLALGQVFETPTIADLAMAIAEQRGQGAGSGRIPDSLTLLRGGSRRRPLFLAPPAAGTPVPYLAAVSTLDTGDAVFGFQTPGLNEGEKRLATVTEIAGHMVSAMREIQPEGPYRIAGWSFGAMVAWEAASSLQGAGERVETLMLLDAGVEDPRRGQGTIRRAGIGAAMLAGMAVQIGLPRSWERVRYLGQMVGVGLPDSPARLGPSDFDAVRRSVAAWGANASTAFEYVPGPYDGEVVLVRAMHSRPVPDPLLARLSELTGGRVRLKTVPGGHMTMMLDPSNAQEVGRTMADAIRKEPARARKSTSTRTASGSPVGSGMSGKVRIVALDGTEAVGGTGYVAASLLRELRNRLKDEERDRFLNSTDVFSGTSAGSANALFLAMAEKPDDALDRINDFWVESEKVASTKGMSVPGLVKTLIGIGPLMSTKKLRGFYLDHFGMTRLGDLPHKVVIPTVCLASEEHGKWYPKAFHNLDPDGEDLNRLVVDVLLASSSPPLMTPAYQSLDGVGPGYVDGGVWANNPSIAALAQVISRRNNGSTEGISILSVSNGDAKISMKPKFRNGFADIGYFGWLLNPRMPGALLDLLLTVEEDATGFIAQSLLVDRFMRLDPDVPGRMLEFSRKGIEHCVNHVLSLDDTHMQLDETLTWLSKVDWFSGS